MNGFIYPATLERHQDSTIITFRDIPQVLWVSYDGEDLQKNAAEGLQTSLSYYFKEGKKIPFASKAKKGEMLVYLPLSFVAKIILHNAMLANRIRPVDLARALGEPTSEIARITNPNVKIKIDKMEKAVRAAGGTMQLTC